MRIQVGVRVKRLRDRLEPDEPFFDLAVVDGRPALRGDCDFSNAATIEGWLATFGRAAIDVDLSGVTFFDAAALRALLAVARDNPNMRIVAPSPIVQRVLDVTGTRPCLVDGASIFGDSPLRRATPRIEQATPRHRSRLRS